MLKPITVGSIDGLKKPNLSIYQLYKYYVNVYFLFFLYIYFFIETSTYIALSFLSRHISQTRIVLQGNKNTAEKTLLPPGAEHLPFTLGMIDPAKSPHTNFLHILTTSILTFLLLLVNSSLLVLYEKNQVSQSKLPLKALFRNFRLEFFCI